MITAIFDLDGTIADTIKDLANAVNYGLRQLNCPEHSVESYKQMVGNGARKLCFRALPDDRKNDSDKLYEIFREYYGSHYLDSTTIYSGIKEVMERLSENGVKIAIATNKPQDTARKLISHLLPDVEFVKVLGGCDSRPKKPDTAIISEILRELPDTDNTVYMIGDSNVDIQTAKNSGLISIGCLWGFRSREELEAEGADHIAEKTSDIADIILGCAI